jgi:pimeloyl-ACP methyl ester carboxylesterase
MSKAMNVMKGFVLIFFLGVSMAFCNKDDSPINSSNSPNNNSNTGAIDYHQTAVTQFISAGETKFAYRVLGDKKGIPLIMIASLGSSMDDWDPAITNGLAQRYKVIIFDIQGVGSSSGTTPDNIPDMAEGVEKFINALGYTKVNLLGFSMGSFISQQIVLNHPDLVNKIILTGTGPKGAEGLSNLPKLLAQTAGLTPEQSFLTSHFTSSDASQTAGKLSYERIQKRSENRDAPVSGESATAGLKAVLAWAQSDADAFKELKNITKPVLIVQGESDFLVPVVNATNMSKNIPGAQLIVYPDAGHGALYQYHDEFINATLDFLGK